MIAVDDRDKIRIAKSGANKLFEVDYDEWPNMTAQELIELFDRAENFMNLHPGYEVIDETNFD